MAPRITRVESTEFEYPLEDGGLDSPAAFADFAEACRDMGCGGFQIHGWGGDTRRDFDRERAAVHAVGEAVGDEMDLMHDPACELETFADALELGRTLDEEGFCWYEDPSATAASRVTPTERSRKSSTRRSSRPDTSGGWNSSRTSSPGSRPTSSVPTPSTTAGSPAR